MKKTFFELSLWLKNNWGNLQIKVNKNGYCIFANILEISFNTDSKGSYMVLLLEVDQIAANLLPSRPNIFIYIEGEYYPIEAYRDNNSSRVVIHFYREYWDNEEIEEIPILNRFEILDL